MSDASNTQLRLHGGGMKGWTGPLAKAILLPQVGVCPVALPAVSHEWGSTSLRHRFKPVRLQNSHSGGLRVAVCLEERPRGLVLKPMHRHKHTAYCHMFLWSGLGYEVSMVFMVGGSGRLAKTKKNKKNSSKPCIPIKINSAIIIKKNNN